jgi:isopenicillin-N N-acyltransferase-like protein
MTAPFLTVDARGVNREIGRAIGEAARDRIAAAIDYYQEHHEAICGIAFRDAVDIASGYLVHVRRHLPQYVEELEGMAEGAGIPLASLAVPNFGEELTCNEDPGAEPAPEHCTSLAIMKGSRRIVAHNEDWYAGDADNGIVVHITTLGGTEIVAVTPAWSLPFTGINSYGIATCSNTIYASDSRVGLPNNIIRRWMLESRTLEEAGDRACHSARARGANHLLGDAHGRIWDIETSATAVSRVEADDWYAHTNHYLSPAMAPFEVSTSRGSRVRHARAADLISEGLERGDDPFALAAAVLGDHANAPSTICSHPDQSEPIGVREQTTASMIWDLESMTVDAGPGLPCENERRRFALG